MTNLIDHILSLFKINDVNAHVGYLVNDELKSNLNGSDFNYLLNSIRINWENFYVLLFLALVCTFGVFIYRNKIVRNKVRGIILKLESYEDLVPWMLRLSLGILLIGAGATKTLITPVMEANSLISNLEIIVGFCILLGFLMPVTILFGLFLYFFALNGNIYYLGNLEILGALLGMLILANSRPGVDDILGLIKLNLFSKYRKFVPIILRVSIGVAFIYLGLWEKILNPHMSEYIVNTYNLNYYIQVNSAIWVLGAGLIEILLGIFFLIGYKIRFTAVLSFLVLSLSFFFFAEEVYAHVTLFGVLSAILVYGKGRLNGK